MLKPKCTSLTFKKLEFDLKFKIDLKDHSNSNAIYFTGFITRC